MSQLQFVKNWCNPPHLWNWKPYIFRWLRVLRERREHESKGKKQSLSSPTAPLTLACCSLTSFSSASHMSSRLAWWCLYLVCEECDPANPSIFSWSAILFSLVLSLVCHRSSRWHLANKLYKLYVCRLFRTRLFTKVWIFLEAGVFQVSEVSNSTDLIFVKLSLSVLVYQLWFPYWT